MATIVAVHGAMHGGWARGPARRILTPRGREAHTPTLAGHGDRSHLLAPEVGLAGPVAAARPGRVRAVVSSARPAPT